MNSTQSRLVFKQLVTFDGVGTPEIFKQGEMLIEAGRVREIRSTQSPAFEGETIDWSDGLVLPGFVNAHCHLSLSGLHGKVAWNGDFVDWIRKVVEANAKLSIEERLSAMKQGAHDLLCSGVTTLVDYLGDPGLLPHYHELPFRQLILLEMVGFDSTKARDIVGPLKEILEQHSSVDPQIRLGLAPHAPYSTSPVLYRALHSLAMELKLPVSSHAAEVEEELELLSSGEGPFNHFLKERGVWDDQWRAPESSPVQYLDNLGVLQNMQAVHLNFVNDSDLDRLAKNKAGVVFCPGSTQWFGRTQSLPIRSMRDRGIEIGMGTDSLASNHKLNFLYELKQAKALKPEVSNVEWLYFATRGGGKASGLDGRQLAPGKWADAICFRMPEISRDWADQVLDEDRQEVDGVLIAGQTEFDSRI